MHKRQYADNVPGIFEYYTLTYAYMYIQHTCTLCRPRLPSGHGTSEKSGTGGEGSGMGLGPSPVMRSGASTGLTLENV